MYHLSHARQTLHNPTRSDPGSVLPLPLLLLLLLLLLQLYHMRFTPLRSMYTPPKPTKRRNPLLHWGGVALLTYGTLAAAGMTHRRLAREGKSPLGQVRDPVAQAVVGAVDAVGQSAENLISTAAEAVQSPGQTASAIKSAAMKGVSVTVEGSSQAAGVIGRQVGKVGKAAQSIGGKISDSADSTPSDNLVHGEVQPRHRKNVFKRVSDGVVKRTLGVVAFLSKPFAAVLGHQVKGTVAEALGAF